MAETNSLSDEEADYDMRALYNHVQMTSNNQYAHSSTSVARSRSNVHLNRYNNVAPYDEHRVILSTFENNDYINASIARGVADPDNQFYILAQGPLNGTIFDFWRMAWENGCQSVVMLNKLIEQSRHKCARYWPEKLNEPMLVTHAESDKLYFTVTLEEEHKQNRIFVKRRLHLTRNERQDTSTDEYTSESKTITHFHYVAWPDFGVPETPDEFAAFFDLLHEHKCFTDPDRPSIVHCSAGIGRTGTLILVDSLLKKLRSDKNGKIDLYDIVEIAFDEIIRLRQYRMGLIQTADQLDFSIKAIKYLHNRDVENAPPSPPEPVEPYQEPEPVVEAPPVVPAVAAASIVATSTDVFEEVEVTKENAEPEAKNDQIQPATVGTLIKGALVIIAGVGLYSLIRSSGGSRSPVSSSVSDEL